MDTNQDNPPNEKEAQALGFLMEGLESYGSNALALAERARTLVGVDGIERIARTLVESGEPENGEFILGALRALRGQGGDTCGNAEQIEGFHFVTSSGYAGKWA